MHILLTVVSVFLTVLVGRICVKIKTFCVKPPWISFNLVNCTFDRGDIVRRNWMLITLKAYRVSERKASFRFSVRARARIGRAQKIALARPENRKLAFRSLERPAT